MRSQSRLRLVCRERVPPAHVARLRHAGGASLWPRHRPGARRATHRRRPTQSPVVGRDEIVKTHSETTQRVAEAAASLPAGRFDASDVRDRLQRVHDDDAPHARSVRRALREQAGRGYLARNVTDDGVANLYRYTDDPGAGEVGLPAGDTPDEPRQSIFYTWSIRVGEGDTDAPTAISTLGATIPAPTEAVAGESPGGPPG